MSHHHIPMSTKLVVVSRRVAQARNCWFQVARLIALWPTKYCSYMDILVAIARQPLYIWNSISFQVLVLVLVFGCKCTRNASLSIVDEILDDDVMMML